MTHTVSKDVIIEVAGWGSFVYVVLQPTHTQRCGGSEHNVIDRKEERWLTA